MDKKSVLHEAGLTRRSLLSVLAGAAVLGTAALVFGPDLGNGFDLKSWPVRTVEIKNFTFDPATATIVWREYDE